MTNESTVTTSLNNPKAPLTIRHGPWLVDVFPGTETLPAAVSVKRRSDGTELSYVVETEADERRRHGAA